MKRAEAVLLLGLMPGVWMLPQAGAQDGALDGTPASHAHVTFSYENPKLQPAKYVIQVSDTGSGIYRSETGDAAPPDAVGIAPQSQDRPVQISPAFREQVFALARQLRYFQFACDDSKDKVAFQGKKQLSYEGPSGGGSCTYNWSKDQRVQKLTDHFEAMAFTLEEGRKLEVQHQHDRLGLDAELETLAEACQGGRAAEIENIAPQLQAIIDDDAVMDRARNRARLILGGLKPR